MDDHIKTEHNNGCTQTKCLVVDFADKFDSDSKNINFSPLCGSYRVLTGTLLCLAVVIVSIQRVNLPSTMVCMVDSSQNETFNATSNHKGEFVWNKSVQSLLLSGFYWGFLLPQLFGAWLAYQLGPKRVLGFGIFMCTVISIASPEGARLHWTVLFCLQILLGLIQGVLIPCQQMLGAAWSPPNERSRLIGFTIGGHAMGIILSSNLSGIFCEYGPFGGWPLVYYTFGVVGLVWCILWAVFASNTPNNHPFITEREKRYIIHSLGQQKRDFKKKPKVPWIKIITSKPVWATTVANFCSNWGMYSILTNLPIYLNEVFSLSVVANGAIFGGVFAMSLVFLFVSGSVSDFLITKKYVTIAQSRKIFNTFGFILPTISLLILGFFKTYSNSTSLVPLIILIIGIASTGSYQSSGHAINYADIAPPFAGFVFAISNTPATLPGILAPNIIGFITKNKLPSEWLVVFLMTGAIYLFGAVVFVVWSSGEVQPWAKLETSEVELECNNQTSLLTENELRICLA